MGWKSRADKIVTTQRNAKLATLGGSGRKEIIPFARELMKFVKDRRENHKRVSGVHLLGFIKLYRKQWLLQYLATKPSSEVGYNSLLHLCHQFLHRHKFSYRIPVMAKALDDDLIKVRDDFALKFWAKHELKSPGSILNVDETAIYYDMPPGKTWAEIGGSSKVDKSEKHSDQITAVLKVRADGRKLPILFIVHGKPGGSIETTELPTYPIGHIYCVQENAWMDNRVWEEYLTKLLPYEIEEPSVVIVDNFESHVSEESIMSNCDISCYN